jgi:hypothetical protein
VPALVCFNVVGMNWLLTLLLSAVLGASVAVVRADDSNQKRGNREDSEKRKDEWKKLSPEERDAKTKEWRKTNGGPSRGEPEKRRELKNMTPEEHAAKRKEIKERLERRIAELRAKQANATLSAQESRELERREQILKRFEQDMPGAPRIERAKPVFTNAPVQK